MSAETNSNPFINNGNGAQAKVYVHGDQYGTYYKAKAGYQYSPGNYVNAKAHGYEGKYYTEDPVIGAGAGVAIGGLGSLTYSDRDVQDGIPGKAGVEIPLSKHVVATGKTNFENGDKSAGVRYNNGNLNASLHAGQDEYKGNNVQARLNYKF